MGKRPYGEILRLFGLAEYFWPSLTARYYQINLLEVPLTKFLDLVWGWIKEVLPQEAFERFEAELEAPIPGIQREPSQAEQEEDGAAFMSAMATLQRGG